MTKIPAADGNFSFRDRQYVVQCVDVGHQTVFIGKRKEERINLLFEFSEIFPIDLKDSRMLKGAFSEQDDFQGTIDGATNPDGAFNERFKPLQGTKLERNDEDAGSTLLVIPTGGRLRESFGDDGLELLPKSGMALKYFEPAKEQRPGQPRVVARIIVKGLPLDLSAAGWMESGMLVSFGSKTDEQLQAEINEREAVAAAKKAEAPAKKVDTPLMDSAEPKRGPGRPKGTGKKKVEPEVDPEQQALAESYVGRIIGLMEVSQTEPQVTWEVTGIEGDSINVIDSAGYHKSIAFADLLKYKIIGDADPYDISEAIPPEEAAPEPAALSKFDQKKYDYLLGRNATGNLSTSNGDPIIAEGDEFTAAVLTEIVDAGMLAEVFIQESLTKKPSVGKKPELVENVPVTPAEPSPAVKAPAGKKTAAAKTVPPAKPAKAKAEPPPGPQKFLQYDLLCTYSDLSAENLDDLPMQVTLLADDTEFRRVAKQPDGGCWWDRDDKIRNSEYIIDSAPKVKVQLIASNKVELPDWVHENTAKVSET